MSQKIVLASNNPGKIREIQQILSQHEIVLQSEFNVPDVEETGTTFVENAIIKARNAAKFCDLPALADDSGIEVDALNGAPGVYSARYAGLDATDQQNLDKLIGAMQNIADDQRGARFRCVIVLMRHATDPCPMIAEASWEGSILRTPRGEQGFGYDPIFRVQGMQSSSAELLPQQKNQISHRAQAIKKLGEMLRSFPL